MSSHVFQFLCGDGKGGAPDSYPAGPSPSNHTGASSASQLALPDPLHKLCLPQEPVLLLPLRDFKHDLLPGKAGEACGASEAELPAGAREIKQGLQAMCRHLLRVLQDSGRPLPSLPSLLSLFGHHHPHEQVPSWPVMAQAISAATPASPWLVSPSGLSCAILWTSNGPADAAPFSAPAPAALEAQQGGRQKDLRKPAHPVRPPATNRAPAATERPQTPTTNLGRASTEEPTNPPSFTQSQAAPVPAVPKVTLTGAEAQLAKNVDEQFLKDLMSADILDILSQLDIQLEGRSAVDHIPKGLSTAAKFLLYRQELA